MLEKTLESPLDRKEIKPAYPKRNQPWILIGRTDAEDPILWPPDVNSQLIGKDPHAGKDWGQEEKGAREEEMVGWHHRFSVHEYSSRTSLRFTSRLYSQDLEKNLTLKILERKGSHSFCNKTWNLNKLRKYEKWPLNGTLNYNTISWSLLLFFMLKPLWHLVWLQI